VEIAGTVNKIAGILYFQIMICLISFGLLAPDLMMDDFVENKQTNKHKEIINKKKDDLLKGRYRYL
jgi:hypothetical protein